MKGMYHIDVCRHLKGLLCLLGTEGADLKTQRWSWGWNLECHAICWQFWGTGILRTRTILQVSEEVVYLQKKENVKLFFQQLLNGVLASMAECRIFLTVFIHQGSSVDKSERLLFYKALLSSDGQSPSVWARKCWQTELCACHISPHSRTRLHPIPESFSVLDPSWISVEADLGWLKKKLACYHQKNWDMYTSRLGH